MITYDEVIEEMGVIVQENPDYKYEIPGQGSSCLYMHGDEPGCGVGHWLHRRGINVPSQANHLSFRPLLNGHLSLEIEPNAVEFLSRFQRHQDMGIAWEMAFEMARSSTDEEKELVPA